MSELNELFADAALPMFRKSFADGKRAFDSDSWQEAVEMGLVQILVPECLGGSGGRWRDVQGVLQASGRYASPLPVADAMLAARFISDTERQGSDLSLGLALVANGRVHRSNGRWLFTGETRAVAMHPLVDSIVAIIEGSGQAFQIVVQVCDAEAVREGKNLAGEPRHRLTFVDSPARVHELRVDAGQRLLERATLLRLAQIDGALTAILERTVEYAGTRKQFGRPLSAFQAVQQLLAVLAEEVAAVNATSTAAFLAADRGDFEFEVACAKLRANEAIGTACQIAHQVHGAIGVTRESDLHHFTRRLLSWRSELGNDHFWATRLGGWIAARGGGHFWSDLTARGDACDRSGA